MIKISCELLWQHYFNNRYKHYGYTSCSHNPPLEGCDFLLINKSNHKIYAELETSWKHYILHKHPQDIRFNKVTLLILPYDKYSPTYNPLLPKHTLTLDGDDFRDWLNSNIITMTPNHSCIVIPRDNTTKPV